MFATGRGSIGGGYPNGPALIKSGLALIVVLIGFRIGEMLRHRVSQELFRKAVLVAFFMGLLPVINGLTCFPQAFRLDKDVEFCR